MKMLKELNFYHLTTLFSFTMLLFVIGGEIDSILGLNMPGMLLGILPIMVWIYILRSSIKNGRNWRAKKDSRNSLTGRDTGDHPGRAINSPYSKRASARKSPGVGRFIHNRFTRVGKKLPVSRGGLPILAKRGANLWYDNHSKGLCFVSLNGSIPFGIDADAVCTNSGSVHISAPHAGCDCGFYAVANDADVQSGDVVLLVELSGVVIEHDKGYRAQHQRVLELQMDQCYLGNHKAEYIVIDKRPIMAGYSHVSCERHLQTIITYENKGKYAVFSRQTLSEKLGVPVTDRIPDIRTW